MKIILTGTANAGKSTLLEELGKRGHQIFSEAETPIVQRLKTELGLENSKRWILENYSEFKEMVGLQQEEIDSTIIKNKPAFYDRSAICYIAYCKLRESKVPEILKELASKTNPDKVLFLEKLTKFNKREETGRFMEKSEANKLAKIIEKEYIKRGFELIRVPEFSKDRETNLAKRIEYIEGVLGI